MVVSFDFVNKGINIIWFVIFFIMRYIGVNSKGYSIVRSNVLYVGKVKYLG